MKKLLGAMMLVGLLLAMPSCSRAFIVETATGALEVLVYESLNSMVIIDLTTGVQTPVSMSPEMTAAIANAETNALAEAAALDAAASAGGLGTLATAAGTTVVLAEASVAIFLANDLNNTLQDLNNNPNLSDIPAVGAPVLTVNDINQSNPLTSDYWSNLGQFFYDALDYRNVMDGINMEFREDISQPQQPGLGYTPQGVSDDGPFFFPG